MIIDCHAHVSAPVELWAYKASILSHRGSHGRGKVNVTDEQIRHAVEEHKEAFPHPHLHYIDKVGTKMQLISPRPFQLMHSEEAKLVQWFQEEVNNIIYRETQLYPDRFIGIAGIPTAAGEPLDMAIKELERCVNELGFKGTLLNPDPYENTGTHPPALGDQYWYQLYEKLCELDIPAHIHGTGSRSPREPYSLRFINEETTAVFGLINSNVLKDFPELKIVVSHGGGAMPYQLGRFQAGSMRREEGDRFIDGMHKLYFDTVLYTKDAIELLLKVVGPERALFGAECPGVGSKIDPATGREMDDIAPYFHEIDFLTDADREMIFSGNAKRVFKLDV
ncbi:MAG: amidohydrolase family protein [Rhodospirillales bacterium]|jgi:predicted TIM-barrel fold metal-dependent hydrolase|nr:amidohydrolase family protein [Rhodospirillales bacterium]MDP7423794.1 amidohydrolase family protein [Rhodospirillales bacterium]